MIGTSGRYGRDIRPLKRIFAVATAVFLVLATTCAILERNRRVQEKALGELTRARSGLSRLKEAILNRRQALSTIKAQLVRDVATVSPERLIYGKVDEIKARLKPDDMTIGALEKKGGDVSLTFTLKFINPNYGNLLNAVSQLQQSAFPFTPVNAIAISQGEQNGKGVVEFTINGTVLTPERNKP
ncbi:MAG TPA: hypothetical protein VF799_06545 [Geobacteraceae bacterium]